MDKRIGAIFNYRSEDEKEYLEKRQEAGLAEALFIELKKGGTYSVRLIRTEFPHEQKMEMSLRVGHVQEYHLRLDVPRTLNWRDRLRVLWSGEVPWVLR